MFNSNTSAITLYLYNAEGQQVAKGHAATTTTTLYCPIGAGDFVADETYVVGQDGEQVSEVDGNSNWKHSNVYVGGQLLATYDHEGATQLLHFNITDVLGTKRVQTTATGAVEQNCLNLPFGDGLTCNGSGQDATEQHSTGKERDAESGLDYFGARYMSSTMGRFTSPDPGWFLAADLSDPQSLNQYSYVSNNPLSTVDPDGLDGASTIATCALGPLCRLLDLFKPKPTPAPAPPAPAPTPTPALTPTPTPTPDSWTPDKPLPGSPTGLGPGWVKDTGHRAPNDENWINPSTGNGLQWHPAMPGERSGGGK